MPTYRTVFPRTVRAVLSATPLANGRVSREGSFERFLCAGRAAGGAQAVDPADTTREHR